MLWLNSPEITERLPKLLMGITPSSNNDMYKLKRNFPTLSIHGRYPTTESPDDYSTKRPESKTSRVFDDGVMPISSFYSLTVISGLFNQSS